MERATLKIEIPFTDHAHCIGRQGNQIQSIMTATETHIHFPDGNREPNGMKSNQVSITGSIQSIENARKLIKNILPMSLKFLFPSKQIVHIVNDDHPLFDYIRKTFHITVLLRSYAKTGDIYCIVRGLINQQELVEATEYLIQSLYGYEESISVKVTCQIEVSEQYHVYLQTRQQSKDMCIATIEQYTHTKIRFPTTLTNGRKTSVTITGSAAQVCQARKLFDLCLPIILIFEIPNDKLPSNTDICYLNERFNVTTSIRTRKDKNHKLITIQSQEHNSDQLFHAREMILGLSDMSNKNCSILEQTTSDEISKTKKQSPIGHERSSLRNFDRETNIWPIDIDSFSLDNSFISLLSENNYCSKLFTALQSTFEHDEITSYPIPFEDVKTSISHLSFNSLLSI